MKYKSDKLLDGIIAGSIASLVKDLLSTIPEFILHMHPTVIDYASYWIFIRARDTHSFNLLVSIFSEICFGAFLGTIYNYLKEYVKTRYIILKGVFFGASIWFGLRGIITLLKLNELKPTGPEIVIINIFISSMYGLILAYLLKWLESKK